MKAKVITYLLAGLFVLTTPLLAQVAVAQGGCGKSLPGTGDPLTVLQAIRITQHIPETYSQQARGVFFRTDLDVNVPAGARVLVTSNQDGLGPSCGDDVLVVKVEGQVPWEIDFASPDGTQIIPAPGPVDISHLFPAAGFYQVTVELRDDRPHGLQPPFRVKPPQRWTRL